MAPLTTNLSSVVVGDNLASVRARMACRCCDARRSPTEVKLVCVSKNFGSDVIQVALDAEQRVFGENRVQEAIAKWAGLRSKYGDVELHLIGSLQSNKVNEAVRLFDVIETVDRPKIARAIAYSMHLSGKNPRLFLQVNTGKEPQKAGVAPSELGELLKLCRLELDLSIEGLMCIPPTDELVSPHFALLSLLAANHGLKELSMGMSDDFELAIQLGSTHIRVGSAIFGTRRRVGHSPI